MRGKKRIPGVNYNLIEVGTHLPILVRAFDQSQGDVLELGAGYFSTTILRWLCEMSGRTLYTYENRKGWYDRAMRKPAPFHKVIKVEDWKNADIDRHWGLVFIDHDPVIERSMAAKRLAYLADYIVIHDTNPELNKKYKYDSVLPFFKYHYNYVKLSPNTSVLSNFHSLEKFI